MKSFDSYDFKALFRNLFLYQVIKVYKFIISNLNAFFNKFYEFILVFPNTLRVMCTTCLLDELQIRAAGLETNSNCVISNPSVVKFNKKIYFISRINKFIEKNKYGETEMNLIHEFDNNFTLSRITLLDDSFLRENLRRDILGLEDIRLFLWKGSIWGIAAIYDKFFSTCDQVLIKIKGNKITEFFDLQSPFDKSFEKNWTPIVRNKKLFLLYSIKPLVVLEFKKGKLTIIKSDAGNFFDRIDVRGGTPTIKLSAGRMLGVAHAPPLIIFGALFYRQLFYLIDDKFNIKIIEKKFFLENKGIEFPCCLLLLGKNIIMSFGSADKMAMYCKIPVQKLKLLGINI